MAFVYVIGSNDRGTGKSYIAEKLGMEFAVTGPEDFPSPSRTAELIHRGDNVVFTTSATEEAAEKVIDTAEGHAKAAGTKFVIIGLEIAADFKE